MSELLEVRDLSVTYTRRRRGDTPAPPTVSGVNFRLEAGAALGIVGESGSGKSTCARALVGLVNHDGYIGLHGEPLTHPRSRSLRRRIQMVFQDPTSSLNPSIRIDRAVMQVLPDSFSTADARRARVVELFEQVRLPRHLFQVWPNELSGGQRQRVAIARALAVEPDILIADEATSALDVSVQATILELLNGLRASTGIGVIFISHDLTVVRAMCSEVIVLKDGHVVEQGPVERVYDAPEHPYTRSLIDAVPSMFDPRPAQLGRVSDPVPHWTRVEPS